MAMGSGRMGSEFVTLSVSFSVTGTDHNPAT
jgi:hypothetical protein